MNYYIKFGFWILLLLPLGGNAQDTIGIWQRIEAAKEAPTYEATLEKLTELYTFSKEGNFRRGLIAVLTELAQLETRQKNNATALRYYLELLDIVSKTKNEFQVCQIEENIGDIYAGEQLYEQALAYYRRSNQLIAQHKFWGKETVLKKMGNTFADLHQPDSAFLYYAQLSAFGTEASPIEEINALRLIVEAYNKAGMYEQALVFNKRILDKMSMYETTKEDHYLAYNNIGYDYHFLKEYRQSIDFFQKALSLTPDQDNEAKAILHTNIGIAYFNLGQSANAIKSLSRAAALLRSQQNKEKGEISHLIANIYLREKDLNNALVYSEAAIDFVKDEPLPYLLSDIYATAATIHVNLYEYEQALGFYQKHLTLSDSLKQMERQKNQMLLQEKNKLDNAEKEIKLLLVNQEVKDLMIHQLNLERDRQTLALDKLQLETTQKEQRLALLQQEKEVNAARLKNQELAAQQSRQLLELTRQKLLAAQKDRELAELAQKEKLQQEELKNKEIQIQSEAQNNQLLRQDLEIKQLTIAQEQTFRRLAYGLGLLGGFIFLMILGGLIYSRKTNKILAQQKEEITQEKNKSEQLLLNILPAFTAQELKEKGSATPRRYENTTVLFADFVNFTGISEKMNPDELVEELNFCFQVFDNIVEKHGLEKIKTIGDAYMCVGGLPVPNESHPQDAARAAIEMMDFIQKRYEDKRSNNKPYWQMRIGLHTGPVVAGVVGKKKFVYDVWGDTANTAARMETNSVPGKINLSGKTYQLVNNEFSLNYRGKIHAKNKGDIDMYFLEYA